MTRFSITDSNKRQDYVKFTRAIMTPRDQESITNWIGIYPSPPPSVDNYTQIRRVIVEPGVAPCITVLPQSQGSIHSRPRGGGPQPKRKGTFMDRFVVGLVALCIGTCLWIPLSAFVGCSAKCCLTEPAPQIKEDDWIRELKYWIRT